MYTLVLSVLSVSIYVIVIDDVPLVHMLLVAPPQVILELTLLHFPPSDYCFLLSYLASKMVKRTSDSAAGISNDIVYIIMIEDRL